MTEAEAIMKLLQEYMFVATTVFLSVALWHERKQNRKDRIWVDEARTKERKEQAKEQAETTEKVMVILTSSVTASTHVATSIADLKDRFDRWEKK